MYNLATDVNFADFLDEDVTWKPKSADINRGFKTQLDSDKVVIKTAAQRAAHLNSMLNVIAGFVPVISRMIITRDCNSLKEVFQKIGADYGFVLTGSSIIDAVSIKRDPEDSVEDVFQKIHSLVDSCLLTVEDDITHHGRESTSDEPMSQMAENLIICLWLKAIHPQSSRNRQAKILYSAS